MTSITSVSSSSYSVSVSSLDTDGDGVVSAEELEAAGLSRTQDPTVSSENAASSVASQVSGQFMMTMLNSSSSEDGSMPSMPPGGPQGMGGPSAKDMFSSMDTDGDGSVTKEEFLASAPEGVSEEDALAQYNSIDTEGTGSITEDQFTTAMEANRPAPPEGIDASSESTDDGETEDVADILDQMSAIIAQYMSYGSDAAEADTSTTA